MNYCKSILSVSSLMIFLTACGGGGDNASEDQSSNENSGYNGESYEWTIGFNTPEDSVRDVAAERFKEVVEEQTSGEVTINIQPGEVLGTEQEMLDQVDNGSLEFQLAGGSAMQGIVPEYSILTFPFLVQNFDEAYALLDGEIGDELKSMAQEENYKVLAHTDLGFAQITNNGAPINEPADLEGLQIRSPEEPVLINTFEQLGASVTTMPFTEVYLGLQQGVIDGQFNPLDAIYENNFHEVQDNLALTNHSYYHVNFVMNNELWEGVDSELQSIIEEASMEAQSVSREFTQGQEEEMLDTLQGEFEEITEPESEPFREEIDYSNLNDAVDEDFVNRTEEFVNQYRENNE